MGHGDALRRDPVVAHQVVFGGLGDGQQAGGRPRVIAVGEVQIEPVQGPVGLGLAQVPQVVDGDHGAPRVDQRQHVGGHQQHVGRRAAAISADRRRWVHRRGKGMTRWRQRGPWASSPGAGAWLK